MKFRFGECREVDWVITNTSPFSLEEKHRRYLAPAIAKGGFSALPEFTDNEVRAVAAAIDYHVKMMKELVKGYPNGNKSILMIKQRIEILEKAYERLEKLVKL